MKKILPKRKTQKTETETSNISFQELMRLLGKTIAIIGEPIHCSYHETAKNVLYHKKLIPKARIKNLRFTDKETAQRRQTHHR